MKRVFRFVYLLAVAALAGCSGFNLPFGSQGGEPRPLMLYCEYAIAHDKIQFTPNGQYLLSGNCLWPMSSPIRERPAMNLNSKPVEKKNEVINNLGKNAFRYIASPDNQTVAVVDMAGNLRLMLLKNRKMVEVPEAGRVYNVLFSPDGRMVTRDVQSISIWDVTSRKRLFGPLAGADGPLDADGLLLSPDGKLLAAWAGPVLDLFDMNTGAFVRRLGQDASGAVQAVAFAPDSLAVAMARAGGLIEVYSREGALRTSIAAGEQAIIDRLLFSHDSTRLAASAANQRWLGVWQALDGTAVQNYQTPVQTSGEIYQWSILPGGQLFVIFEDGLVAAWSLADGQQIYALEKAEFSSRAITTWPDFSKYAVFTGNLAVYQSSDGSQLSLENVLESKVWKQATGITSGDIDVESIAVSPNLNYIAIQLFNQNAILWPVPENAYHP